MLFSRREFAGGAFATGLLSLVSNADAEGSASVAGGDEVLKRMKLTRRTVHVGLAKPFSVVHASDSHIVRVSAADLGVMDGVNFVQYDNGGFSDYLAPQQFEAVKAEFAKGLPVVLLCHMPFWSEAVGEEILRTHKGLTKDRIDTGYVQGRPDKPNWGGRLEMTEWLRKQEQLKAVLCGHLHHDFTDDFSPTAKQYVAAANYRGAVCRYDFV